MKSDGNFSLWGKKIIVIIDGIEHDISDRIPEWVWRYETQGSDNNLNNPIVNWKIRVELAKEATKILREITGSNDVEVHC